MILLYFESWYRASSSRCIRTEEIRLPDAPPPTLPIGDEPLLNPNSVTPDNNPDTMIDQLLRQAGFDSDADIAAIYIASQVACTTLLDIPIHV